MDTVELAAVMPTVEMNLQLPTVPMPRADRKCAWCTISLTAIPDRPLRFTVHDDRGRLYDERWTHPGGCADAFRLRLYGLIPDTVEPWGPLL